MSAEGMHMHTRSGLAVNAHTSDSTMRGIPVKPWPRLPIPTLPAGKIPLCYRSEYNIKFAGLEKMHPFDSCKYGNVYKHLMDRKLITPSMTVSPSLLSQEELEAAHTAEYLESLRTAINLARIAEIPVVAFIPACVSKSFVLNPMLYACKGTILSAHFAMQRGFGINLSGGYHHASKERGHGFCFFNDISQAIWSIRTAYGPKRVMIVDLDAHQGDGHEHDFKGDPDVYIFDAYTPGIFPNDASAKKAIGTTIHFQAGDTGERFIAKLRTRLAEALAEFSPDLVCYNAGTDILAGDPLSSLSITRENVILRDEVVFDCCGFRRTSDSTAAHTFDGEAARTFDGAAAVDGRRFVPVFYLLSGGYQSITAGVIGDSIANLHTKFGILSPEWKAPVSWTPVTV